MKLLTTLSISLLSKHSCYGLFTIRAFKAGLLCLLMFCVSLAHAHPILVKDINATSSNPYLNPRNLVHSNGILYFSGYDPTYGQELWRSDGTAEGTFMIKDLNPGLANSDPSRLLDVNGTLYFRAYTPGYGYELWKTDGTLTGTQKIVNSGGPGVVLTKAGNTVFYSIGGDPNKYTLTSTKGENIVDIYWTDEDDENDAETLFTEVGNILYISGNTSYGNGLIKTDGTKEGTSLVKAYSEALPRHLTNVNGTLFFTLENSTNGRELWKTDGTQAGTKFLKSFPGISRAYEFKNPTSMNGNLFFAIQSVLWRSDGTPEGTVPVKEFPVNLSSVEALNNVNGVLFFIANIVIISSGREKYELWKSDGTSAGTALVKAIDPKNGIISLIPSGGFQYFILYEDFPFKSYSLWRSDGSQQGTFKLIDFPTPSGFEGILYLTDVKGTLFFTINKNELWKSDGTVAGTVNVFDVVGPPVTCSASGSILREVWNNVSGSELASIPVTKSPTSSSQLSSFQAPSNTGDNYGSRIRGYICAPVSGTYTFYLSGDNNCALYLSTDDKAENKTQIASITGFTYLNQWNKYSSQKSAPVVLQQGKRYYIEALQKETNGGDHLSVGWQTSATAPISVIPGSVLSPYVPQLTGKITREFWANVQGFQISNIPLQTPATTTDQITSFERATNQGDNYGQRLRGYLHPQVSGNYRFFIAGDDKGELYLSTDEDPLKKTKIASVTSFTSLRQWNKYASQQSVVISLVAGKKYYIEALHKENSGNDHISVGWQLPNQTTIAVIAGSYLSPFMPAPTTATTVARVGVKESLASKVSLFPNPFESKLTLSTKQAGKLYITITDNLGRTVYQSTSQAGGAEITLESAHLKAGVYVVKVSAVDGSTQVVKVVKK